MTPVERFGFRTTAFFRVAECQLLHLEIPTDNPDMRPGFPLFQKICLELPAPLTPTCIAFSLWTSEIWADIRTSENEEFRLDFSDYSNGWMLWVSVVSNCTDVSVRSFYNGLSESLETVPEIHGIRWFLEEEIDGPDFQATPYEKGSHSYLLG